MFSSLNSFGLLSTRFVPVNLLLAAFLILPVWNIVANAEDSGGPEFKKPVVRKPENPEQAETDLNSDSNPDSENKPVKKKKRQHQLIPALRIAKISLKSLDEVVDYKATFYKTEFVGNRYVNHHTTIKFRENPFSVYMGFEGAHKGREILYVAGTNNGNLIAKESGVLGIVGGVSLRPTDPRAMAESLFPVTDIGMKNLLVKLIKQWETESKFGECEVKITNGTLPVRGGKPLKCKVIDSKHPRKRRQFLFHHTRLIVDRDSRLPVSVEQYGFPNRQGQKPPLLGKYMYVNVKTNLGLKNIDFDVKNREYNF